MTDTPPTVLPRGTTLLPASAGTGKTFHIVDLLLDLVIDEGQALDRMVVVTFTEAAAGELRERIRERLVAAREGLALRGAGQEWKPPDEVLDDWVTKHVTQRSAQRASTRIWSTLTGFDTACITTIHGFCARVLTEAAFEAGAPFATDLIGDATTIASDVVADFWLRRTWGAPPATLRSFEALALTRKALLDLAKKSMNPALQVVPEDPGTPDPVDLTRWRSLLARARKHFEDGTARARIEGSHVLYRRKGGEALTSMPPGRTRTRFGELREWLDGEPVPGPSLPECVPYLSTDHVQLATKEGQTAPAHALFDCLQELVSEHAALAPALTDWRLSLQHEVIRETRERLAAHLRQRNALTYDEMLRRVRIPVTCPERGPALRKAVRRRYDAALVDEFQDTDPDQWDIFRTLFGHRLYLVGDPKQAIYSFRGADFDTYLRAQRACTVSDSLDRNYRSDKALVDAVNHLFQRDGFERPFFASDIAFPEVDAYREDRGIVGDDRPALQIRLLDRQGRRLKHRRWLAAWQLERDLPNIVANDIVRALREGRKLHTSDGERLIGPGDCAVLTRKNEQARAIAHALIQRGVPATTRSEASVLASPACTELIHVLRAVHDPLRTALVRRALLTELLGVSTSELAAMQQDHERWGEHAARFRAWRRLWEEEGVLAVVRALLDAGGTAVRLLAQGRERRATDLRHLGELFQRVAAERRLTPTGLLGWIEEGCPGLDEDDTRLRLETDAEAVQCVTVHSAKGLEYPLVWAPWLHGGSWVSKLDREHLVIADPDHPKVRRLDLGSPDKEQLVQARKDEAIAEDLRLIYVALTRARHRLVLYHGASGEDAALFWLLNQRKWMKKNDLPGRWRQVQNRPYYYSEKDGEKNLIEDLEALVASAKPGLIHWDRVDWGDADKRPRWEPAALDTEALQTAEMTRGTAPDRAWGRASFTGLTRQVHEHQPRPEVDHDEDVEDAPIAVRAAALPLAEVRGSARFGVAVHSIFEHHDFQSSQAELRSRVASTLRLHDLPAAWTEPVTGQLQRSLHTPLLHDFRLADLPRQSRWDELDFALPVRGDGSRFRVDSLQRAFDGPLGPGLDEDWRVHLDRLDFLPVHGFLVGSIDLVFRHAGRWYLADYKSNTLGPDRSAYAPDALREPMYKALYPLQYHLYAVALLRLLRARIPGFDAERDFGGVLYLFVRGMDPAHPGHGVFYDRPPLPLLERLDHALGGDA